MDRKDLLLIVLGVVLIVVLGLSLALQATALVWLVVNSELQPDFAVLLEEFVDEQIDSGLGDYPLDTNDPLLKQRKILLGHTVNSRSAKHVATEPMYLNELDST